MPGTTLLTVLPVVYADVQFQGLDPVKIAKMSLRS